MTSDFPYHPFAAVDRRFGFFIYNCRILREQLEVLVALAASTAVLPMPENVDSEDDQDEGRDS